MLLPPLPMPVGAAAFVFTSGDLRRRRCAEWLPLGWATSSMILKASPLGTRVQGASEFMVALSHSVFSRQPPCSPCTLSGIRGAAAHSLCGPSLQVGERVADGPPP